MWYSHKSVVVKSSMLAPLLLQFQIGLLDHVGGIVLTQLF